MSPQIQTQLTDGTTYWYNPDVKPPQKFHSIQVALKEVEKENPLCGQIFKQYTWLAISPEGEMARTIDLRRADIPSPLSSVGREWGVGP